MSADNPTRRTVGVEFVSDARGFAAQVMGGRKGLPVMAADPGRRKTLEGMRELLAHDHRLFVDAGRECGAALRAIDDALKRTCGKVRA